MSHKEILQWLEQIENKLFEHDDKIMFVFECIKQLEQAKQEEFDN